MKTRAAAPRKAGTPREAAARELGRPEAGEMLTQPEAAGTGAAAAGHHGTAPPGGIIIGYHRKTHGSLSGGANPLYGVPMTCGDWHEGHVKLAEAITRKYRLDEINEGHQDLMVGKNTRGVTVHRH